MSRVEGFEELKRDVFVCYKSRKNKLKARPKVLFESEEGAGNGPVCEFLSCAMKIVEQGMNQSQQSSLRVRKTIVCQSMMKHYGLPALFRQLEE